MVYTIKEGNENNIIGYTIIVEDFSCLINSEDFIIRMVKNSQLFKIINFPDEILYLIIDTVIKNKDINHLKDKLTEYNIPLYSLIINLVNNIKLKYQKLLEINKATCIEIICNKSNFLKGLELGKILNKQVVIDGREIPLVDYKKILSNCPVSNTNIKVLYQDQNSLITIDELYQLSILINNITENIQKYNLSPLEKIIYVYDMVKKREYKECYEDLHNSRDVDKVLVGNKIVCTGYSNLFNAILRSLGINALPVISSQVKHQRSLVYISDSKYNIDGVYVFDPTWDRKKDDKYIDNYNYFGITISRSERDCPSGISSITSIKFEDVVKASFSVENDTINKLEELFNFIKECTFNEFYETIIYYNFCSSTEKEKAHYIYRRYLNKCNPKEIEASSFLIALYNIRIIEFYSGIITSLDIEELKEVVINRANFQEFNYSKIKDELEKILHMMAYNIKLQEKLNKVILECSEELQRKKINIKLLKVLRNAKSN